MRVSKKNFLKIIKFLVEMRKAYKADQPFLIVCCTAKFILFVSGCLSAKYFVFR